jgi:hypothetical protein
MVRDLSQIKTGEFSNTNFSLDSNLKEIIMKEKTLFILFFIIGIMVFRITEIFGQSSNDPVNQGNFLKVGIPIVHNQVKDNLVAPLKWDGMGSGLGITYMSTELRVIHEVSLIMSVSGLKNRYKYTGYALEVSLGYILSCMVIPAVWGGTIYLGPQIKWNGKTNFFRDWDDSHIYWFTAYEFGPSLKWSKDYKEKQNILFTMQLPFVALVSRPPENQYIDQPPLIKPSYYFKSLNKDLKLVTLNNYFSLRLQADYSYKIKGCNMIGGSWLFDYKSCKIPRNTTIVTNIMMINYYKVFGKK